MNAYVPAAEVGRVPILELLVALCVGRGTPARGLSEGCPGPIAASARRAGPGSPGRLHRRSLWPALRFPRPADPPLRAPGHPRATASLFPEFLGVFYSY